jgi:hypothetical protein
MKYLPLFEEFNTRKPFTDVQKREFLDAVLDYYGKLGKLHHQWHNFHYGLDSKGGFYEAQASLMTDQDRKDTKTYFKSLGINAYVGMTRNYYLVRIRDKDEVFRELLVKLGGNPQSLKMWIEAKKPLSELDAWLHQKRGSIKGNEFGF